VSAHDHALTATTERRRRRAHARARRVGHLLDESIRLPVAGYRIGLDSLLGLVPVGGDVAAALLSLYVVFECARAGAPPWLVFVMTTLVAVDVVIGAIPIVGDLFDAVWKANAWNVRLLERFVAPAE
jgi:hypothetical protein